MPLKISIATLVVIGLLFLPTTLFLIFGMMPTLASAMVDKTPGKNKSICIGTMNFAGCFPFLLEFWTSGLSHDIAEGIRLIADVQTVLTIYILAAGGYAIDMAVTGITSSIIIQRAQSRMKTVAKEQKSLVKRWGEKVTGLYKLDDYGFPVNPIPSRKPQKDDNDS